MGPFTSTFHPEPETFPLGASGLTRLALILAAIGALSFGTVSLILTGIPAAFGGLALYLLLLAVVRPRQLRDAWAYVRELHRA